MTLKVAPRTADLDLRWHEIPTDYSKTSVDKYGNPVLFATEALGLQASAKEKRDSLPDRIAKMMELRAEDPDAHGDIAELDTLCLAANLHGAAIAGKQSHKLPECLGTAKSSQD